MKSDAISKGDRQFYLGRALAAADWFVNSQAGDLPAWDANRGRFLYYYYMPEGKSLYGIVWTHGRALFVLAEAYRLTGDDVLWGRRFDDAIANGSYRMDIHHTRFLIQDNADFFGFMSGKIIKTFINFLT